jgi:hypothetical protein
MRARANTSGETLSNPITRPSFYSGGVYGLMSISENLVGSISMACDGEAVASRPLDLVHASNFFREQWHLHDLCDHHVLDCQSKVKATHIEIFRIKLVHLP